MKTAAEWKREMIGDVDLRLTCGGKPLEELLEDIQRDALDHAANICEGDGQKSASYSAPSWDASRRSCAHAIRKEKP